jgi:hypothetical protein
VVSKVVPYKYRKTDIPMVGTGSQYVDGYPMGYPFDRPVYWDKVFFDIPNAYFYETKIYHRDADAVNYSQQDYYSKQQTTVDLTIIPSNKTTPPRSTTNNKIDNSTTAPSKSTLAISWGTRTNR